MVQRIKRTLVGLMAAALMAGAVPTQAVDYMPDVTEEMASAKYWSSLQSDPGAVLMTLEEIRAQNAENIETAETNMCDLRSYPDTIDGVAQAESLRTGAEADARYYLGWTFDAGGGEMTEEKFDVMVRNGIDPDAEKQQPVRWGIAVNRTTLNTFASDAMILDDPADPDFNYQPHTAVRVNEPVAVLAVSADKRFYLARSICGSGWLPVEDVALCRDRNEWMDAWDFDPEDTLVVYGSRIVTAASNFAPEVSQRIITQGSFLELAEVTDPTELVNNRFAYNNHVVYLPVRDEEGNYVRKKALIAENAPVHEGLLPMTKENIAMVAFQTLGDNYGWGGMLMADDCSLYVRNVYRCFGMELGRNTTWQSAMPVFRADLSGMDNEQKAQVIANLPLGSTLFFNGHEMMLLGTVGGKSYVVSAVSSIMNPLEDGKRQRARSVIINTLDIKRANGNTWLQDLNLANVPYCGEEGPAIAFTDVPEDVYYRDAVKWAVWSGVTSGTSKTTFSPEQVCTRGQIVTFLWRAASSPEAEKEASFEDVPADSSCARAVDWAVENGITAGTSDTEFSPKAPCTRAQIMIFLWRAAGSPEAENGASFKDVSPGSSCAKAVAWAVEKKITAGTSASTFSPKQTCTRAEAMAFLYKSQAA